MARNIFRDVATVFDAVGRGRRAAGVYEQLSSMSDAELARRGYNRTELAAVAFKVAFDQ
jgi:hypothetical protein